MCKAQYPLGSLSYSFRECLYQLLMLMSFIVLLFVSTSSFAIVVPTYTCDAGDIKGSLADADYATNGSLLSSFNSGNYVNVAGNASGTIPLKINMSTVATNSTTNVTAGSKYIRIDKEDPHNSTTTTTVTLSFKKVGTDESLYLSKVGLSIFDIDKDVFNASNGRGWSDQVRIIGKTSGGGSIDGSFQKISGSNVIYSQGLLSQPSNFICDTALDTSCQASVAFAKPVDSVIISYNNTSEVTKPKPQDIDLRVDNYCYTPPSYTFSGIVFNDNGSITDAQADVRNANYLNGTYNNANYFNGSFDNTSETGIAGSTVSLVNCANSSTVYATKAVENSGSNIGKYQIIVASATLAGNNRVCIIETNNNTSPAYPIRTTTEKQSIPLTVNNYSYPNNNFGRVITKNAALVLEKEQAANDCKFTNFTSLTYSKNPLSSSTTGAGTDIKPGQCIAYKITATNRSNVAIQNFVMRDVLQLKDPNNPAGPTVTSVLAGPARAAGIFNDGLSNGQNGTVTTIPTTLPKREKRIFYFNTQYGSTQSK